MIDVQNANYLISSVCLIVITWIRTVWFVRIIFVHLSLLIFCRHCFFFLHFCVNKLSLKRIYFNGFNEYVNENSAELCNHNVLIHANIKIYIRHFDEHVKNKAFSTFFTQCRRAGSRYVKCERLEYERLGINFHMALHLNNNRFEFS